MHQAAATRESLLEKAKAIYDQLDDPSKVSFVSLLEGLGSLLSSHWEGVATELRKQYGKWEEAIPLADAAEELNVFFASLVLNVDGRLEQTLQRVRNRHHQAEEKEGV